jgi:DNA-binding response OmpR family regulator
MLSNFSHYNHFHEAVPVDAHKKKVLVVEDSPEVWFLIQRFLGSKFDMAHSSTLGEAREKMQQDQFDLVILDVILPDGDGMKFCLELTESGVTEQTPVILLTAKGAVPERVQGLSSGADDYIPKPFDPRELLARAEAVLRRRDTNKVSSEIRVGNLVVDLVRQKAYAGPHYEAVDLTPIEFRILAQLLQAKGGIVLREDLFKGVWGGNIFVSQRNIDTHICKLRHKIAGFGVRIISKRGHGYRIELDHAVEAPVAQKNTGTDLPLGAING